MSKRKRDSEEDPGECSICHDPLEQGRAILMLECGHDFHLNCIQKWLCVKSSCPNCRQDNAAVARSLRRAKPAAVAPDPTLPRPILAAPIPTLAPAPVPVIVLHIPPDARRFAGLNGAIYDWDRGTWIWNSRQPLPRPLEPYLQPASRVYVRVPFAEKDQAKELGANWDPVKVCWYFYNQIPQPAQDRWRVVTV